jgi:hypothetical protein
VKRLEAKLDQLERHKHLVTESTSGVEYYGGK